MHTTKYNVDEHKYYHEQDFHRVAVAQLICLTICLTKRFIILTNRPNSKLRTPPDFTPIDPGNLIEFLDCAEMKL